MSGGSVVGCTPPATSGRRGGSARGVVPVSNSIEVVAHRGGSAEAPEHSLAAYRKAIASRVDALECDVRMTRDGRLVCVHDRRIDATSSGSGVVSALPLTDLEGLEFGVRAARRWALRSRAADPDDDADADEDEAEDAEVDEETGRVLTVDRLLDYVTSTPGEVRLAIETKHPTRHGRRVEVALVETLRRFGLLVGDRPVEWSGRPAVRVMSFSPVALRRLRVLAPGLPTVHLVRWPLPRGGGALAPGITAVGAPVGLIRLYPGYVARLHAAGLEVNVFTVNDERDMDLMVELGVDAVITDRPMELLRRLGRAGPEQDEPPAGISRPGA